MRTESSQDPKYIPMIDQLDKTTGKSYKGLVKPLHEFAKSVIETSSKVCELFIYD